MQTEAVNEYNRQAILAIGLLESILGQVKALKAAVASGKEVATWGDVGDMKHTCKQLQELEDRVYGCGEYAPENVARA